jgi:hypothetical protein
VEYNPKGNVVRIVKNLPASQVKKTRP